LLQIHGWQWELDCLKKLAEPEYYAFLRLAPAGAPRVKEDRLPSPANCPTGG